MIRHLTHPDVNKSKWDACIDQSPNGLVYAKTWFLDIISPGWEALVDDDYVSVFPLTCRRKFWTDYLYQPFFTQQLGVFSTVPLLPGKLQEFFLLIPEKFRLVEIQLNSTNQLAVPGFQTTERLTHHLDLDHNYFDLQKNYSENLKRNLKRALQNSLSVITKFDTRELVHLFRQNRGKEVKTLKPRDYQNFIRLIEEGEKRNLVTKVGISVHNNLEAGALFIRSNREYIFLFSATTQVARDSGAMTLIIDYFLQRHHQEKMLLDFEGSMDEGLARFYKSFGSREVVYLQLRKNRLPFLLRWMKKP